MAVLHAHADTEQALDRNSWTIKKKKKKTSESCWADVRLLADSATLVFVCHCIISFSLPPEDVINYSLWLATSDD